MKTQMKIIDVLEYEKILIHLFLYYKVALS